MSDWIQPGSRLMTFDDGYMVEVEVVKVFHPLYSNAFIVRFPDGRTAARHRAELYTSARAAHLFPGSAALVDVDTD